MFQILRDNGIAPRIAEEAGQMLTIASLGSGELGVAQFSGNDDEVF
jgi:hypothetical protein